LRIVAGIIVLFLALCIFAWLYISRNKASILQSVKKEVNSRISGEITIGNIDASIFQTFPRISFGIFNVSLRDSLWKQHHHDFFKADQVFVELNIFRLITGKLRVSRIIVQNATAYLFTDSTGYTNASIFKKSSASSQKKSPEIPDLLIRNSRLFVEKQEKNKFFDFEISKMTASPQQIKESNSILFDVSLSAIIHTMAFNRKNGSFVEQKPVSGKIQVQFNPQSKILQLDKVKLAINRHPFLFTGKFFLSEVPALFVLNIQTENLEYREAAGLLSANIRNKLNQYSLSTPIVSANISLDGTDPEQRNPLVRLRVVVKHADATTPLVSFTNSSFTADFTNEWIKGKGRDDENSMLRFTGYAGSWQEVPMQADTVTITNLIHPLLNCDLHAKFDLTTLNNISEEKIIEFSRGTGKMDIVFRGPLQGGDTIEHTINGDLKLDSADINYTPRNFTLTNCSGNIRMDGTDMLLDNLVAHAGSTELNLKGAFRNIFSILVANEEKLALDCQLSSPKINLNDFTAFLKKGNIPSTKSKSKLLFVKTISKISKGLAACDVHMQLKAKQLNFENFFASNVNATLTITNNNMLLKDVSLDHAGGSLVLSGSMLNAGAYNNVSVKTKMKNMDINKVFIAFDNFGQKGITSKNIFGRFDADVNLSAQVTEKASIVPNSAKGTIDFNIRDGELVQFEPVEKIQQTAFKKRDFSDISFAELKDKFDVDGKKITVNRMEIHSTVMTMFVEGTYDMKDGTDMSIQIPLSNLKGSTPDSLLVNKGINSKTGPSVRLRAKTGDDGKLKVTWDPFKKALKKTSKKG